MRERPGPVKRRPDGTAERVRTFEVTCGGRTVEVAWRGRDGVWAEAAVCDRAVVLTAPSAEAPATAEVVAPRPISLRGALARVEAEARRRGVAFDGTAGVVEAGVADVEVRRGARILCRCRIGTASGRAACGC